MASQSGQYDDSDHESLSNELSPTDGYFNERHTQPQRMMVLDPSQHNARTENERDARDKAHATSSSHHYGPEASRLPSRHSRALSEVSPRSMPTRGSLDPEFDEEAQNEGTPLLPPAPLAYSPPDSDSPFRTSRTFGWPTRSEYSTMGGSRPFLLNRAPEDLGGREPLLGGPPRDNRWRNRTWEWLCENTNRIAKGLLIFLALAMGVVFIVNVALSIKTHEKVSNR